MGHRSRKSETKPSIRGHRAEEEDVVAGLCVAATLAGVRRGATFEEEVRAAAEAVGISKVTENFDFGGEARLPSNDGGGVQLATSCEGTVDSTRAERRLGAPSHGPSVLEGDKG